MNTVIPSKKVYWLTYAALMLLLLLTWAVARANFGVANTVIALLIAGAKMFLVLTFFMQLRYHPRITWIFAAAGLIWLLIMITLTLSDYLTRPGIPPHILTPAIQGFK